MPLYPGFSTQAMDAIWSPESRIAAMLEVEAAVAYAQGEAGDIPKTAAMAIAVATAEPVPTSILAEGWTAGTPVLPLLDALRSRLDPAAAEHLHRGLTTQDVVDTAAMLLMRDATGELRRLGEAEARTLVSATERFGNRSTTARSFLQPAEQTTYGFRFGRWAAALDRQLRAPVTFPVQLGGLIGDRRELGPEVVAMTSLGLELDHVPAAWHTDRTPVVDLVTLALRFAQWAEKVAGDIALLSAFGEVATRAGGSSAAAGKQNPIDAMRAMAAAEACAGVASIVLTGKPHELERGLGSWHAEWFALPLVFMTAGAAMEAVGASLASLEVLT